MSKATAVFSRMTQEQQVVPVDWEVNAENYLRFNTIELPSNATCPLGFFCDSEDDSGMKKTISCSVIRDFFNSDLKLGDVFGGIYCPEGVNGIEFCREGYYCPTPEVNITCPAGKFCIRKSVEPWIDCINCEEGAIKLERQTFGYVVFSILIVVLLLIIGFAYLTKYKREKIDQQAKLSARQVNPLGLLKRRKRQLEQLDRLKPKLEIIARRLDKLEVIIETAGSVKVPATASIQKFRKSHNKINKSLTISEEGLQFNAKKLYDVLDTNNDGLLSYKELNTVLDLNDTELATFCRRMQELGCTSQDCETISRPVFVRYFLQALEETNYLKVNQEEAEELYTNILNDYNEKNGGKELTVKSKMFYTSELSLFLTDEQIYALIKKFQAVKAKDVRARRFSGDVRARRFSGESSGDVRARRSSGESSGDDRPRRSTMTFLFSDNDNLESIAYNTFVSHYPLFLKEVMTNFGEQNLIDAMTANLVQDDPGVDICFKDLSLTIKLGNKLINVVDHLTGRIQAKTMTALMGGSGAGKSSLLNALSGRAYYGTVTGDIHINGLHRDIGEIKHSVGFVPQDDIVYSELTVRENLMYAGKFRLPSGTSKQQIRDLVDETLANLGLSRVADRLVGDVRRRGVSGGEKKRVNIGLELMAKPRCLFLDEPTSGLDASSALLVMQSLKRLVTSKGVTIVSVIHQPRKFIFDLFDSLVLLGVGGRMVYHGPVDRALEYFECLDYVLPIGESVADFLIDISSGRLEVDEKIAEGRDQEQSIPPPLKESATPRRKAKKRLSVTMGEACFANSNFPIEEQFIGSSEFMLIQPLAANDCEALGSKGVSMQKANDAVEEAKVRRAWLYNQWDMYFEGLDEIDREIYSVPHEGYISQPLKSQTLASQIRSQTSRAFLVSWRNIAGKMIDTAILFLATLVITYSSGLPTMTLSGKNPEFDFATLMSPTEDNLYSIMREVFSHLDPEQTIFPTKIGIIVSVLIALQATKILTSKRIEFFREASSGYDINAFFVAINMTMTVEFSLQISLITFFIVWLREPVASWFSFFVHFLMMQWVCVSWAIFIPMVIPPDNVSVLTGVFLSFTGLIISGISPPITYARIYSGGAVEFVAGWLSPVRFFIEALSVGEFRCLPPQSGFTIEEDSRFYGSNSMQTRAWLQGDHDVNSTVQSCDGWYWSVLPSLFIGVTVRYGAWLAMHGMYRGRQTKKSLLVEMRRSKRFVVVVVLTFVMFILFIVFGSWLFTREIELKF